MKSIGFRAEKDGINWAVVEGTKTNPVLVASDYIKGPNINTEAAALSYFRERILAVVKLHGPTVAFVRFPESFRQKGKAVTSLDSRLRIEGVILEALNSAGVDIMTGAIRPIASKLGSDDAKAYLVSDDIRGLAFPSKDINSREAILVAVSALEKGSSNGSSGAH